MNKDWQKLINSHPEEKRNWDSTYPWIYYVARPISFPISWLFYKMGISANHVTIFTAILGIASVPLLASGETAEMAMGASCLLFYTVFDCVDGDMARAWPSLGSPAGQYWGELVGNFYLLAYFSLGLGLRQPLWIAVGAGITIEKFLAVRIRDNFWDTLGNLWEASKKISGYQPHTGKWYYRIYWNLVDPQGHVFLLPVIIALGWTKIFLAISALIAAGELIFVLALCLCRAQKIGSGK
ncbi:MAG: CDP-alcohol phosphatidyltransferase family protein [Elusimicrobia bacterium]|nr:CDP-alcohol phosphatidyltransferase family protein [Elusimicrobiota bacterium]